MYPQTQSPVYGNNKIEQRIPYPAPPLGVPSAPYADPGMYPPPHRLPTQWSTGLFHCCDDPANCVVTCLCPCITFGQIADIVDQGTSSCAASGTAYALLLGFTGFACLYSCMYRSKLRAQYDLEEGTPDCLVHFCCELCALCQEHRELKIRGFDTGIGWNANMDRQRRGVTQLPVMGAPVMGGMIR